MINNGSILSTDFSQLERKQEFWIEEREKKINLYQAFLEYIEFLEIKLEYESDDYQKYLIKRDIKRLRQEMNKYCVPSVLSLVKPQSKDEERLNNSLEYEEMSRNDLKESILMRVRKFKPNR